MTLVCIGVGVGVKESGTKLPVTYRSDAFVKIGKMMNVDVLVPVEDPESLVELIPIVYDEMISKFPGYHFDVRNIPKTDLLKLTMEGHDSGVERVLKELVDMLIDKLSRKAKDTFDAYKNQIEELEEDAKNISENITLIESALAKIKNKEKQFIEYLNTSEEKVETGKYLGEWYSFFDMYYIKTSDLRLDLDSPRGLRRSLRNVQKQLSIRKTAFGNREKYKTEMVGKMRSTTGVPKRKKGLNTIAVSGVAGLIMSLFIAFFIEYIEESKSRRKGNGKVDSA
jgi:hypothetical protein